jgi:hypothetical protein
MAALSPGQIVSTVVSAAAAWRPTWCRRPRVIPRALVAGRSVHGPREVRAVTRAARNVGAGSAGLSGSGPEGTVLGAGARQSLPSIGAVQLGPLGVDVPSGATKAAIAQPIRRATARGAGRAATGRPVRPTGYYDLSDADPASARLMYSRQLRRPLGAGFAWRRGSVSGRP